MPFNFWFAHSPTGGQIDVISGNCDINKQRKVKLFNVPHGQGAPLSPIVMFGIAFLD